MRPPLVPPLDFASFHDGTFADFSTCATPRREPDFVSRSRSVYWNEGDAVIRASDHWGWARSCLWRLDGGRPSGPILTGRCAYRDFGRFVPLRIEHERTILVAPGSGVRLAGRTVSLLLPADESGARTLGRLGRGPIARRRRSRTAHPTSPTGPLRREIVEIVDETPFLLFTRCGRRLPRRSLGAAWWIEGTEGPRSGCEPGSSVPVSSSSDPRG